MTRTVQEEVTDLLLEFFSQRHAGTSSRNVDIALYLYGFGGTAQPTLEAAGERFENITRERVRQILERTKSALSGAELSSVDAFVDMVSTAPSWLNLELAPLLLERGLVDEPFSISGLLRLAKDAGRVVRHTILPPALSGPEKRRKSDRSADWVRGVEEKHEAFLIMDGGLCSRGEAPPQARSGLPHEVWSCASRRPSE